MTKLLANRWFRWTLLAIALSGLGVGIYRVTPPEPMCVIDAAHALFFADGGRRLIMRYEVIAGVEFLNECQKAKLQRPLQIWDTRTGQEIGGPIKRSNELWTTTFSRDGRYFAAEIHEELVVEAGGGNRRDVIVLLDTIGGILREIPLVQTDERFTSMDFSPDGALLIRVSLHDAKALRIFESATGKTIDARQSAGFVFSNDPVTDTILHATYTGVEVWSCRERKATATLKAVSINAARSPDGRYFVAACVSDDLKATGKWGMWNLQSGMLESEFHSENPEWGPISADGRWLTATCVGAKGKYLELRQLPSGKQVASIPVHDVRKIQFSANGQFLLVNGLHAEPTLAMLEVPTLKALWHQARTVLPGMPGQNATDLTGVFSMDSQNVVFPAQDRPEVLCYDCVSGRLRSSIPLLADVQANIPTLRGSLDGRNLLVHQTDDGNAPVAAWKGWLDWLPFVELLEKSNDAVIVFDMVSLRERLRIIGGNVTSVKLSGDGNTLATVHEEAEGSVIRCWDVDAWKPLHWALGVPAGLAAVIGLFAWRGGADGGRVTRKTLEPNAENA